MHSQPMAESDGKFDETEQLPGVPCRKCGAVGGVSYRVWESSCGGYTDCKYSCATCGQYWWVDGPDA